MCKTRKRPQNHPAEERIVTPMKETIAAYQALFDQDGHGEDCECVFCDDVRGMLYTLEMYHSALDGFLLPFDTKPRRRKGGFSGLSLVQICT